MIQLKIPNNNPTFKNKLNQTIIFIKNNILGGRAKIIINNANINL